MMKLRDEEGKTIFFISHSLSQVREFCKTGMWIEGGQLVEMGDIDKVCDDYSVYVDKLEAMSKKVHCGVQTIQQHRKRATMK